MSSIYIDSRLDHPLITSLRKSLKHTVIDVSKEDISNLSGMFFIPYEKNIKISTLNSIVFCYESNDQLDLSDYLDLIWWDFIDPSYFISLINMSESYRFLGDNFSIEHSLPNLQRVNLKDSPKLRIANAYSYCSNKSGFILYSVFTSALYRKSVYNFFEKNCLNVEENSIYNLKVIDDLTFEIKDLPYVKSNFFDIRETILNITQLINSFKNLSRESLGEKLVEIDTLDEHITNHINYIDGKSLYPKDVITSLRDFYNDNRVSLLKLQSFSQNNCKIDRCQLVGDSLVFDYFSMYNAKKQYTSYLMDFGQLLVGLHQHHGNAKSISFYKDISFYINLLQKEHIKIIYFFALMEDECIKETFINESIIKLFRNED